jgi:hypothetical protein
MIYKSYVLCPYSQRFKGTPFALSCFYAPPVKLTGTVEKGLKNIVHDCTSFEINIINLFLLMYTDDMCLFALSPTDLQHMLDTLHCYNDEWNLTLNVDKTKIVVFRNGGKIRENEKWFYNGKEIEVANQFKYLGMLFDYNGKHNVTQKHVAELGRKAYFAFNIK